MYNFAVLCYCSTITAISEAFSPSQMKSLHPLSNYPPFSSEPASVKLFLSVLLIFLILNASRKWSHKTHALLCLFISLSMMTSRSIYVVACVRTLFILCVCVCVCVCVCAHAHFLGPHPVHMEAPRTTAIRDPSPIVIYTTTHNNARSQPID